MKQLERRPIYHRRSDRIVGHVQLCWLALLLIRTIENQVGDTWRNIAAELDRMQLITLKTAAGCVSQRTRTTARQRQILDKLGLPSRRATSSSPPPATDTPSPGLPTCRYTPARTTRAPKQASAHH
jgi:hypothetical protein